MGSARERGNGSAARSASGREVTEMGMSQRVIEVMSEYPGNVGAEDPG